MKGIYKELTISVVVVLCFLVKLSFGQTRTSMTGRLPTENGTMSRTNATKTELENGINIGESFFLNRLRQGDSEAISSLDQFRQTVDTPMTLLHNFFQVFSRPDLRQRNGVFGLLHNLAIARGLLPNSLAIGANGLPIQHTTQQDISTVDSGNQSPVTTEMPLTIIDPRLDFQINDRNSIRSNANGRFVTINGNINRLSNNVIGSSEETQSEEIIDPTFSTTHRKLQSNTRPSQSVTRNSKSTNETNVIFPSVASRVFNANINQRTPDFDKINTGQRQVIQRDRITFDRNLKSVTTNTVNNNSIVQSTTIIPTRNFLAGGRFLSPSIILQTREDGSEPRGARIFSNALKSREKTQTINTINKQANSNMADNLKRTTSSVAKVQEDNITRFKRPSKLNFMLEMPVGVSIVGIMETVKPNNSISNKQSTDNIFLQQNDSKITAATGRELKSNQELDESIISQSKIKLNEDKSGLSLKDSGKRVIDEHRRSQNTLQNTNRNILQETEKDFLLQRVGHIQLDPKDHVLQVVGEMNLSLAEPELNIQRVGELNIGRRRQFIMDVRVNSTSAEDKILLQRVGVTNLVSGERLQLHGTGDVRLLTKERVIIQRVGLINFQKDPLKANDEVRIGIENQQSNTAGTVRSIFTIVPVGNATLKPSLLFLGRETGAIMNENSNETVLQFVGDVLSEMPLDRLNITHQNMSNSEQNVFNSENVAAINMSDRSTTNNQSSPVTIGTQIVRGWDNESILPVLRENVALKSNQERISFSNNPPIKVHLNSIGRIFSTVELKYENTMSGKDIR